MGCHSLLQGIFLTPESNPGLRHCRQVLSHDSETPGNESLISKKGGATSSCDRPGLLEQIPSLLKDHQGAPTCAWAEPRPTLAALSPLQPTLPPPPQLLPSSAAHQWFWTSSTPSPGCREENQGHRLHPATQGGCAY